MKSKVLDKTSQKILDILFEDARASYTHIAQQVGLSAPAVKERILRMEDEGIITGYTVQVNKQAMGYGIRAFMLVDVPYTKDSAFARFVQTHESISECHHILGENAFFLRVHVEEMQQLDKLIRKCMQFGQPTTHVVLSRIKPPVG